MRPPQLNGREWEPWETELMQQHYAAMGPKGMTAMLPERTEAAVRCKAKSMGVRTNRTGKGIVWTDGELRILYRYYPRRGAKGIRRLLPGRTAVAINKKASELGVEFGLPKGFMPLAVCAAEAGYGTSFTYKRAKRAGALSTFKAGEFSRSAVKLKWAEAFIEKGRQRHANRAFMDDWYTIEDIARILSYKPYSVQLMLQENRPERPLSHALHEVEKRQVYNPNGRRFVYNPWQVEALARKWRDNVAIISEHQLMILDLLGRGLEVRERQGDGRPSQKFWVAIEVLPDNSNYIKKIKRSAVNRLIKFGLAERRGDHLFITDRGLDELEAHTREE